MSRSPTERRLEAYLALGLAVLGLGCRPSGPQAPPERDVAFWAQEAEGQTELWRSSKRWCDQHPGDPRCAPLVEVSMELLFGGPRERPAETFSLVPDAAAPGELGEPETPR